jgi:hypothetical protein
MRVDMYLDLSNNIIRVDVKGILKLLGGHIVWYAKGNWARRFGCSKPLAECKINRLLNYWLYIGDESISKLAVGN